MKTEIIAITDRSGSMGRIASDANGGFDQFIKEQQAIPGEARVTQVMFDDRIEVQYTAKPLSEVPPLNLMPRGSTALLDAIGTTLNTQGERIKREAWADLVIVVVITDGLENASREYTAARVKEMTQHAEANGWRFVFLAANQDAFATASAYGISAQFASNFTADSIGTRSAYSAMSVNTSMLRSAPTPLFDQEQK